jgi:hypothetical protein
MLVHALSNPSTKKKAVIKMSPEKARKGEAE